MKIKVNPNLSFIIQRLGLQGPCGAICSTGFLRRLNPISSKYSSPAWLCAPPARRPNTISPTPYPQQVVTKFLGDISFAGTFLHLVPVGTLVLMPLPASMLIKWLMISTWPLAKPQIISIPLLLINGASNRHLFGRQAASPV